MGRRITNGRGVNKLTTAPIIQNALTKPRTPACRSTCAEICARAWWDAAAALAPAAWTSATARFGPATVSLFFLIALTIQYIHACTPLHILKPARFATENPGL